MYFRDVPILWKSCGFSGSATLDLDLSTFCSLGSLLCPNSDLHIVSQNEKLLLSGNLVLFFISAQTFFFGIGLKGQCHENFVLTETGVLD